MAIKYFCDKCGDEIGRKNWYGSGIVTMAQPQTPSKRDPSRSMGRKFDYCDKCYKEFGILFKEWREKK